MNRGTYVSLDVEVLEVESVFPDVDTNDGGKVQEGVLVWCGGDFEALGRGIDALKPSVLRIN